MVVAKYEVILTVDTTLELPIASSFIEPKS